MPASGRSLILPDGQISRFPKILSSRTGRRREGPRDEFLKFRNFACQRTQITSISLTVLPTEGRAHVTNAERDAVDAAASGARKRAGRMTLMRTAKSCRSDAPMLASSLRGKAQATVSNKPGHRGEREVSRKTIARGMPGLLRCTCGDYTRVLTTHCTRGCGCIGHPAFPAPSEFSEGRTSRQNLVRRRGEIAKPCLCANAV